MILIMVVAMGPLGRVRYEGYAYVNIPSIPGSYIIRIQTWKPKCRSTTEKMQNVFLDVSPSLQDVHAVHVPVTEQGVGTQLYYFILVYFSNKFVLLRNVDE